MLHLFKQMLPTLHTMNFWLSTMKFDFPVNRKEGKASEIVCVHVLSFHSFLIWRGIKSSVYHLHEIPLHTLSGTLISIRDLSSNTQIAMIKTHEFT